LLLAGLVHRRVIDPEQPQAANEFPLPTQAGVSGPSESASGQSRVLRRPARRAWRR
jgi:hypothetical protein